MQTFCSCIKEIWEWKFIPTVHTRRLLYLQNSCSSRLTPEVKFLMSSHSTQAGLNNNGWKIQIFVSFPCKLHAGICLDPQSSSLSALVFIKLQCKLSFNKIKVNNFRSRYYWVKCDREILVISTLTNMVITNINYLCIQIEAEWLIFAVKWNVYEHSTSELFFEWC